METLFVLTAVCLNSLFVWPDETNGNYNCALTNFMVFLAVCSLALLLSNFRFMLPPLELFTDFP